MTYNSGCRQNLQWGGGNMALTFNNCKVVSPNDSSRPSIPSSTARTCSATRSRCCAGSGSIRRVSRCRRRVINRDNAELNLKARTTNTLAAVRSAYWDYVFSIQAVDVAQQSLALASKLLSDNKIRVEVGTMAPMDVVQAEAEEATRQQALTTRDRDDAHGRALAQAADCERHQRSALVAAHRSGRSARTSSRVTSTSKAAVRAALQQRTDLQIARNNFETNNVLLKSQRNQSLPDVDAIVTYGASGTGRHAVPVQRAAGSTASRTASLFTAATATRCARCSTATTRTGSSRVNVSYPIGGNASKRRPRARGC